MGIDLTIKNTNTNQEFYAPTIIAREILDVVFKRRDSKWKTVGTPCVSATLDKRDIDAIYTIIQNAHTGGTPEDDEEYVENLTEWFSSVIDDSDSIVLNSF